MREGGGGLFLWAPQGGAVTSGRGGLVLHQHFSRPPLCYLRRVGNEVGKHRIGRQPTPFECSLFEIYFHFLYFF